MRTLRRAATARIRDAAGQPRHESLVLAAILTCQLMVVLDATIVTIALPEIRTSLHFSTAGLSWVLNAYTLSFGGLLLLGARAGDIVGRRLTFVIGITLFTVASLLGGFSQSSAELLTARAAQGIGGALASPAALALLISMHPEGRERNRAIGWYTAVSVGGSAVGLIAGGVLTEWASWRWVLFVNVPIGIALVLLARLVLPETERSRGEFDLAGALTSTVGMTALVYGFVRAATDGWSDTRTIGAFVVGVVLLGAFLLIERRATLPITPLRLFADRNRASSYVARLFLIAGMMGMFFFLTQFLQNVLRYSPLQAGAAFLPITVLLFVASQSASRWLIERFGAKQLMVVGVSLSVLGLGWLTQLSAGSGYGALLGPLMLFGTGNGLAFVPLTAASLSGVAAEDSGAGSGLVNVVQQVGGSLGLAILVTVFGAATRNAGATSTGSHTFVRGADRAFDVSTLFVFIALLLVIVAIQSVPTARRPDAGNASVDEREIPEAVSAAAG